MRPRLLEQYLSSTDPSAVDPGLVAYLANLELVAEVSPSVAASIVKELADQRSCLKLIASENYCSLAVQGAMANLLTDKYAEGYPFKRFYAGCDNVDALEQEACAQACELFKAEHAYVQPHSGADANLIAFWAVLTSRVEKPALAHMSKKSSLELSHEDWDRLRQELGNQRLLGMDLFAGGHLTHGYRMNISSKMFDAHSYAVSPETDRISYDAIARQAEELKPLILLAGYSSYPRHIDFSRMREIADSVGAVLMVDMAHFAGLVAGGVLDGEHNPIPYAHIVTSTTHKTLRGPRGGLILAKGDLATEVDRGCPLVMGGPLPHVMAAKAVAFREALRPEFSVYARAVVDNARVLAEAFESHGIRLVTGGTDNHLVLADIRSFALTGRQAESALRTCGLTLNRNVIPFDPNGPWFTSGLRFGTAAITTLGMGADEMREIAAIVQLVLANATAGTTKKGTPCRSSVIVEPKARDEAKSRVTNLLSQFPLYPNLDLSLLSGHLPE